MVFLWYLLISTVLDYRLFLYSSRYHSLSHPLYNTLIISADIGWYLFLILNSAIAVAEIAASSNLYLTLYLFLLIFVQFLIFTCAFADIAAWSNLYITLSLYLPIYVGIYRIWFSLVPLQWQIYQPDPLFTSKFYWYMMISTASDSHRCLNSGRYHSLIRYLLQILLIYMYDDINSFWFSPVP